MSESLLKPGQLGHATVGQIIVSDGTRFAASHPVGYELPIVGPIAGISGDEFLGLAGPIIIGGTHIASEHLRFVWQAADAASSTALWRLRNRTTNVTILSGTRACPFSWVLDGSSAAAAAAMPAAGDEIALEVRFSVAASGSIDMRGPATWRVR